MHLPGISVGITEMVPGLCNIAKVFECIEKCGADSITLLRNLQPNHRPRPGLARAIAISILLVIFLLT
jgi:hypothetical protein